MQIELGSADVLRDVLGLACWHGGGAEHHALWMSAPHGWITEADVHAALPCVCCSTLTVCAPHVATAPSDASPQGHGMANTMRPPTQPHPTCLTPPASPHPPHPTCLTPVYTHN